MIARWAARRRGTKWESWVALRIGDVFFTEVAGAFMIGFAVGGLLAPQFDDLNRGAPVGRIGPGGRFGGFGGDRLPLALATVAAGVAVLTRVDLRDLLLKGSSPRNAISTYIGWDARVVAPIRAGEYGEIALRDGSGNLMSVVATSDTDIAAGTLVRITGTKDLNLVVTPLR